MVLGDDEIEIKRIVSAFRFQGSEWVRKVRVTAQRGMDTFLEPSKGYIAMTNSLERRGAPLCLSEAWLPSPAPLSAWPTSQGCASETLLLTQGNDLVGEDHFEGVTWHNTLPVTTGYLLSGILEGPPHFPASFSALGSLFLPPSVEEISSLLPNFHALDAYLPSEC